MIGTRSLVVRRARLPLDWNHPLRAARPHAHTNAAGLTTSLHPDDVMLKRANQAAAANPPPRPAVNNAALAKQPPPSAARSSVPPKSSQSIANMFARQSQPPPSVVRSSSQAASASTAAAPLRPHSVNVPPPAPRSSSHKPLASLYGNSDSFKEEPDVIDLTDSAPRLPSQPSRPPATAKAASTPYFDENNYSDEDLDDMELYFPSALPAATSNPPASGTSVLSGPRPSPSHLEPPRPSPAANQQAAKRSSPDDTEPVPVAPKKAKRQLPWASSAKPAGEDSQPRSAAPDAASQPKPKPMAIWESSESALKAQKKQLKTHLKGSAKTTDAAAPPLAPSSQSKGPINLSAEQQYVKTLVVDRGQSVFFTGPAGTGKSVLMRAIIHDLKKKHARDPERVAVTASTGLAACNIGGMTLHSFAGIGLGKEDVSTLVKKIRRNPKAKNRWTKTKVLIIDEVSMVDGELFDKLSQIGRIIRNNGRPWGGIQLVITGDFFQLPPVPEGAGKERESKFAFDAATWSMSIDHTIGLTEVFRQRDPEFAAMLNEMRLGRISDDTVRSFQALSRPLTFDDGIEVTELFPTRQEVDSSNQRRLKALTGKVYRYDAVDTGDPKIRDRLLANMMAPPTIELKKGAQVMLIKNMDDTLVNGSLGTVVGFMTEATFEMKAGIDESEMEPDAKRRVRAFTNALAESSKTDNKEYPVVAFHNVDGAQRQILCVPEDWKVELPTGEVQASRKQLPLILAWALSIHKAQGQTLERVKVDLGKVFEKGQAYVALSRATTKQGLQVLNFQKSRVMAHPRVVEFYNKLYSAEAAVKKKAAGSITSYTVKQPAPAGASVRNPVQVLDEDDAAGDDVEEALTAYA
ncbi:hypothetical protein VTJ83DRAFT_858 [Remersonia thermophila]|uniref:ATP-dependent DNA helicase PIF1 n=1 Tax=Remersonia thermophila TaxID=72144 RepID=A0ABR4DNY3_9PEZI